jgi:hypothetical protein
MGLYALQLRAAYLSYDKTIFDISRRITTFSVLRSTTRGKKEDQSPRAVPEEQKPMGIRCRPTKCFEAPVGANILFESFPSIRPRRTLVFTSLAEV